MCSPAEAEKRVGLEEKVSFLSRPGAYARIEGGHPAGVERVETHMAWVFLTDRHAWKLKKPVRYEFLDFSTLEARRRDSLKEVALNARLAPGVYLDVVPLCLQPGGGLRLGADGPVVDWLVRMLRLPAADFLDARLDDAGVSGAEIGRLADVLAAFYAAAVPVGLSGGTYAERLAARIRDDVGELLRHDHHAEGCEAVGAALLGYLGSGPGLFDDRACRVVEGHGDLRPEHVCLTRLPVVIDCLEFNRDFRIVDPLDELAFLAMECEFQGVATPGRTLLEAVCGRLHDEPPPSLVRFYASMRGLLRAKLALSHVWDRDRHDQARWRAKARAYLRLAGLHVPRS
ncbi:MAG: hypothetical protein P8080_07260 [Gammaproteobacteria bacterium]